MSNQQYDNEKKFALFKHDKKGNERAPDYKGTMQVNGVAYKLSAWIRTSKDGTKKFMSGSVEVDQKAAPPPAASYGTYEPQGKVATTPGPAAPVQRDLTGAPIKDDENVPF